MSGDDITMCPKCGDMSPETFPHSCIQSVAERVCEVLAIEAETRLKESERESDNYAKRKQGSELSRDFLSGKTFAFRKVLHELQRPRDWVATLKEEEE